MSARNPLDIRPRKKHTLDFLYTRFCVFSLLEQQQFIFLPTFSRDFCRSSEKPRVDQCMYNIKKTWIHCLLKVELIHCKSCKNVRHHKNFFKRSIQFIHEVLISWWTIMQCLCWNDWLTSKSYKRIRMWIRTNSLLIVLSVCWTLLSSSCNNVAISHFSCGLYVNFTVHKFYMRNVRMTRFVYFERSGLTR